MAKFVFQCQPENDVDFLNETTLSFSFEGDLGPFDSGWCDMVTGARILTSNDRIILEITTEEEEAFVKLKFGDRLKDYA